jgi:Holliday junction resolvasome RuvABC endonuclease subunit
MVAANRVKKYLTGNARADKKEVQIALKFLYGDRLVGHKMTEHNWDALGIAHCYVSGPT